MSFYVSSNEKYSAIAFFEQWPREQETERQRCLSFVLVAVSAWPTSTVSFLQLSDASVVPHLSVSSVHIIDMHITNAIHL